MSASSCELDIYAHNCTLLRLMGASLCRPAMNMYGGVMFEQRPAVVLSPSFAVSWRRLRTRAPCDRKVAICSSTSALVLDGPDITLRGLRLNGTLRPPPL